MNIIKCQLVINANYNTENGFRIGLLSPLVLVWRNHDSLFTLLNLSTNMCFYKHMLFKFEGTYYLL